MGKPARRSEATLALQGESEAETLCGQLVAADGSQWRFRGWMEFASAIQQWREAEQSREEDPGAGDRTPFG